MIKKGDRVKFINDTGAGTVTAINGAIATVAVEDGFDIPALLTDLVAVEADEESSAMRRMGVGDGTPVNRPGSGGSSKAPPRAEKERKPQRHKAPQYGRIALADDYEDEDEADLSHIRQNFLKGQAAAQQAGNMAVAETAKKQKSPLELTDYDIKLCFVPRDANQPENSDLELYMVNDSSYRLFYSVARWSGDRCVNPVGTGTLTDDAKVSLGVWKRNEFSVLQKLQVDIVLYKPTAYIPQPAEDFSLELPPMKFVRRGNYVENDFFEEPAVLFTVASSNAAREEAPVAIPSFPISPKPVDAPKKIGVRESKGSSYGDEPEIIDLHAEEILDSTADMGNGEILRAQLVRFEIALDLAVSGGKRGRIVFIHGVGSGKLKYEIKKLMAAKYPHLKFQDASFKEYGYGAIMVFLK
ncbi:MAG: DUF2027 domain-containing protein [Rikenellaceae bacterium]|jgi:hypothetical protein|nr:DUF2027 domain-containing protein [Rikenellaceae bacterium]